MTSKQTDTDQNRTISILANLEIAVGNASGWLSSADTAAVSVCYRLAMLIDSIFDTGTDLDKLPMLIGRFETLLKQLKLTPVARDTAKTVDEVDTGLDYVENYLRLIKPTPSKPKSTGQKSGRTRSKPS